MKYLTVITQVAEVEIDIDDAINYCVDVLKMPADIVGDMEDEQIIETYGAHAPPEVLPLEFEVTVKCVSSLREFPKKLTAMGYTEDELERDNPFNHFMDPAI